MNKEEFLKIQTCVLKVNIHCDGCKQKVKKILQKIDGVYTIKIDSEQGKVTVSGNIDAATLIKKLTKNGKHAEIWGVSKANNNHQNQLNNQLKNMHIDNGKGGNNKGQGQKNGGNNPPKGGPQSQNPQIQQQLLQLQQLKGSQDLKIPPQLMTDMMRMPINNKDQNQKSVKFSLPEEEGMTDDDDYDNDDDYEDDDEDYDDDEIDDMPMHNKKPVMGNGHGGAQIPNIMMNNMLKGVGNAGNNGGNGAGNLNKGGSGGGNIPVQMNLGGANGGKKGGNGNNVGGNQNQGGGKGGKNSGGQPQDGKNGGGHNKNGNGGGGGGGGGAGSGINFNANGGKNGGGMKDMHHGMMPNMMNVGQMGKNMPMPMGSHQMGHLPMGQMGNLSAVQGLPASAANGGGSGGAGYFPGGANPEQMAGNPYYQQHLATMMMNQQRANGNERFHPMMYARPPPAVNYMPPYPPYPYPPPPGDRVDQYSMFSDENTSSCTVM